MTNLERINRVVKVDKDYLIRYYGIIKNDKGNDVICPCSEMLCADCIFYKYDECTREMEDYLERGVTTND